MLPTITLDLNELLGGEVSPREEIISAAAVMLFNSLHKDIRAEVGEQVKEQIRAAIAPEIEKAFHQPFIPTDEYGNSRQDAAPMTLAEVVVKSAKDYLLEKVDERGERSSSYSAKKSRIAWMADQAAKGAVERDLKAEIDAAKVEVTRALKVRLATIFAESITQALTKS